MRNITNKFIIMLLFLLLFIPIKAEASFKVAYDGKVHTYDAKPVFLYVNGEKINPPMPPIIFNGTTVVPARAVFEKMGASVVWNSSTQQVFVKSPTANITLKVNSLYADVNNQEEKLEIPSKIINGSTMIPLRFVSEKLGLEVVWNEAERTISIADATKDQNSEININKVSVDLEKGKTLVRVEATGDISKYSNEEWMDDSKALYKVVIEIPDSNMKADQTNITVNHGVLQKVRAAQYQLSPKKSRIVLDLVKKTNYAINISEDKKALIVDIKAENGTGSSTEDIKDIEDFNTKLGDINKVNIVKESEKTVVTVGIKSNQTYNISRITKYDAIAIDLTDAEFSEGSYQTLVNDDLVKYLKSERLDNRTGRIIIGVEGQPHYQVFQEPDKLMILISKPSYKNIKYTNNGDTASILIDNSQFYGQAAINDDIVNKMTIISIPAGLADMGTGTMHINDNLVKSVEIDKSEESTHLIINYNNVEKLFFNVQKEGMDKTVVNISTTEQAKIPDGKFLVVIDAGHGGKDPGAKYKDQVFEKELNLDIALKLNKLLNDSGINTVMTRDKDVYVDPYERANMANRLKADLFISIHNNWIDSSSVSGTETLYNPNSDETLDITSKRYAGLVQEELIKSLGTVDRKIVPRPNLVVLKYTEMPAVLAEIGFISNTSERQRLSTDSFRQKAAESLYTGIMKAIKEFKK